MPHRPTSRTPDDTAQDNDARAAIEAGTHEPAVDDFGNQYLARLPDAAELDRLRRERDEAQMEYADCLHELDRLRAALIHIADCPPSADPGQFIRHLQAAARLALRSALAPEGSAGTAKYGHIIPLPEGVDPLTDRVYRRIEAHNEAIYQAMEAEAVEGSARDGG